jgi:signal transduction histidine kinase
MKGGAMSNVTGFDDGTAFTVLVVDDAPENLAVIGGILQPFFRVRVAKTGQRALGTAASESPPDLILLDVMMPQMDGYAVLAALQDNPDTRTIPVIFVTAMDADKDVERGLTLGAVDYVTKPVSPEVLLARVRVHLALAHAKRQLRAQNEDLEERVADRTRDLERAMKAAQAADRAKSEFLTNMGHELRTPITGILAMSDLLLDCGLSEEQREYAQLLKDSASGLHAVLVDILDFAAVRTGEIETRSIRFDVAVLLEELRQLFSLRAAEQRIGLYCRVDPATPTQLIGDAPHLRQILLKLIDNAVKFTARGQVTISVSPREATEQSVTLLFEIRDTGIGIPQERLAEIFAPFTQGDGSSTRKFGGTGLGLTIAQRMVDLLGGQLGGESQEAQGSLFWVELPFARARVTP